MRKVLVVLVAASVALSVAAHAEPRTSSPALASSALLRPNPAIDAERARLAANVRPEVLTKLKLSVRQTLEAAAKTPSTDLLGLVRRSVISTMGERPASDIEAMVLIVMIQAEKDARDDLKSAIERVKAVNDAKGCQRDLKCLEQLSARGGLSKQAAERAVDDLKNKRDSLNEMSELESLRLKEAMERMAKMAAMLSSISKSFHDTAIAIIQNLKA